ncbi:MULTISPECIES: IS66 family transposase [Sphingobacterium]|uniref:IS66 family transposase n=1 Tax=Sphingobacterium TaxID=28453 RepID=UPI00257B9566|nr:MULTISPECIES: transposase [Sphingobacterium]
MLQKEALKSDYLMDETTVRVMDKNKKGKTHRGYFWTIQSPVTNLTFFEYHSGRGQEIQKKILRNYKGYLQSDGYVGYQSLHDNKNIMLMCCMSHVRRYFSDAITNGPDRTEYAMELFS